MRYARGVGARVGEQVKRWTRAAGPRRGAWIAATLLTLASGCFVENPDYEPPADSAGLPTRTGGESSSGESDSFATSAESMTGATLASSTTDSMTSGGSGPMTTASATGPTTVDPDPTNPTDPTDPTDTTDTTEPTEPIPCDVFAQDCEEPLKCVPFDADDDNQIDGAVCVQAGEDQLGEPCEFNPDVLEDSCDEQLACVAGTCMELCEGNINDPVCELSEAECLLAEPNTPLCAPYCDPTPDNQFCELGVFTHCVPSENEFICVPPSGVEAGLSEQCAASKDCKAGYMCLDGVSVPDCDWDSCCTPYCDLDGGVCPLNMFCQPVFEEPNPDYPFLGVCVVP